MIKSQDKRRFIRLEIPVEIVFIRKAGNVLKNAVSKDISSEGLRFSTDERLNPGEELELKLILTSAANPVHAAGKVVWVSDASIDRKECEVGIEFVKIEEDNKNTFLKFLCDMVYNQAKKVNL